MLKHILILVCVVELSACKKAENNIYYEQEMRNFVQGISSFARSRVPAFIVIPQNGLALLVNDCVAESCANIPYLNAIDGVGREELFYGYNNNDNIITPIEETTSWDNILLVAKNLNKKVLVTDYCTEEGTIYDSYNKCFSKGYISFAATHRELDNIPTIPSAPFAENNIGIISLDFAQNFLYIISHSDEFPDKQSFLNALAATNYDVIIIDAFFNDNETYTTSEIASLKIKANGAVRKVIAYMSIGEAEDYRFYWNNNWKRNPPDWLLGENPQWAGNYKVKYWSKEWQNIIYGSTNSYTQLIIDAGFDGVYLDIVEAYEYFEE